MNAIVNIPAFTLGTRTPVVVTFTVINPNLPVDIRLRAASQFHAVFIRAQIACTPTATVVNDANIFPSGGLTDIGVTTGANFVTVDANNAGTGLFVFTVDSATNAVVNIPAFTPGTFAPVTATYTVINPALPVDITLRASSRFHGVVIRLSCGTPPPGASENGTPPSGEPERRRRRNSPEN